MPSVPYKVERNFEITDSNSYVVSLENSFWNQIADEDYGIRHKYFTDTGYSFAFRIIYTEIVQKIQTILVDSPIFATHPKTYHSAQYPIANKYRQLITADLEVEQHHS